MSKVGRNILYNLGGQLMLLGLSFASTRLIYRDLGKDVLGVIYFVMMLNSALAAVLEIGLGATAIKEIAAHIERERAYVYRLIQTGAFYFWAAFVVIALAQFFLAPWIAQHWLELDNISVAEATLMLQVLGPMVFLAFPKTYYTCVFRGLQRMGINNVLDVSFMALQQLGVVLLIASGERLYPVVLWIALTYVFRVSAYALVLGRVVSWRVLVPRYHSDVVRRNASFVGQMSGMMIFATAQSQGDKLVISKLLPIAEMGWYSFAYALVGKGETITNAVSSALFPRLSELSKQPEALYAAYRPVQALMVFGLLPIFTALPFVAPTLFTLVLDQEAALALALPTAILSLCFYMKGTVVLPHFLGLAVERPDIALRQAFYAFVFIFPLTITLIAYIGMTGAALGWLLYQCFAYAYSARRVYRECLKLPARHFYIQVAHGLGLALLTYGLAYAFLVVNEVSALYLWALAYTLASIAYALALWTSGGEEVRQQIRSVVVPALRRIKAMR